MGPPLYMRSVVDRNVVMRRIPVLQNCGFHTKIVHQCEYYTPSTYEASKLPKPKSRIKKHTTNNFFFGEGGPMSHIFIHNQLCI